MEASNSPSSTRAALAVAISACCFGSIPVLVSLATGRGATLPVILGLRYVIAAVVLAAMIAIAQEPVGPSRKALRVILIGGGGQTLVAYLGLTALAFIPVANATFLFYTYPAWVAVIAAIRRTEPITRVRVIALALSLIGISVMVGGSATVSGSPRGVMLALGAAVAYAVYIPTIERLQEGFTSRAAALLVCIGGGAAFLLLAVADGSLTLALHRTAWIAIVVMAIVSTVAAFQLFLFGLKVLGPIRTAIVSTVEPFFAALLGAWLLHQALTVTTLIGGALIIGAVVLLQRSANSTPQPRQD